jgi:predicted acylesterase/phospholipase RssA
VKEARALRESWPFRRPAIILSGGGGLGAYQVGVLKALGEIGLEPPIVLGMSVGAINALAWVANGFHVGTLRRAWLRVVPSTIGMRWTSLTMRAFGLFLTLLAALEIVLTAVGSDELSVARVMMRRASDRMDTPSVLLESVAWLIVGALGFSFALLARRAEDWLGRSRRAPDPRTWRRTFATMLTVALGVHLLTWALGWPWPHRFSATVLVLGSLIWLLNRPGVTGDWLRRALVRLMPESGGRGLWRGQARERLIEELVGSGDPSRLVRGPTHLIVNAVAVDTGRIGYFLNWSDPSDQLRGRIACAMGDAILLDSPQQVIEAASASSALPVLFQPVRIRGHDYVDAGLFASHALDVVIADGADAVLVVLMSTARGPVPGSADPHLVEVGLRLLDLGSWRDLRTELLSLPAPWSREGDPARVCVVEPEEPLGGNLLHIDPRNSAELMRRGEEDAWRALERAGWLEPRAAGAASAAALAHHPA